MSEAQIFPIFSKPLYAKLTDIDTKKIVSMINENEFTHDGVLLKDGNIEPQKYPHISGSNHVLDDNKFKFLKDKLMKEFYLYASNIMKYPNKFEITTSWFTKTVTGQDSNFHNHGNSMISGILYLQTNENSGNVVFRDFNNKRFDLVVDEQNVYNSSEWGIGPCDGLLMFCPSEVHHKIERNKSDTTRHSLAFNLVPIGSLGFGSLDDLSTYDYKIKIEK